MLISLFLIALIAAGGMAVTYLFADDESFMWRASAGTVIGSAIYGTLIFAVASFAGLNVVTALVCLAVTCLPIALFWRRDTGKRFRHDRQRAGGKLQGANAKKFARFAYYAFFLLLFWLFFDRTMYELADGLYTGGSQNYGDLPYHLGAIFSFTEINNFPPQNPSWYGAKFAYPFVSDLLTAAFMQFGADVRNAMFVQNVAWAFSLFVLVERFAASLTGSRLAGRLAPVILFLSGGLGFLWFFKDLIGSERSFADFLMHLPRDYTISDIFRWGNSMVVLFMTQRSLLLGMPLTVIVLGYLWRVFSRTEHTVGSTVPPGRRFAVPLIVGLLAGMLPLIHLHSLAVLFVVTACLLFMQPQKWQQWIAFGVAVCVFAVPELAWSLTGTASDTTKFLDWHFGWDKRTDGFVWFWLKNTGVLIPLIAAGIYMYTRNASQAGGKRSEQEHTPAAGGLLLFFYVPFVLLFVISNVAKLAPWEWDNIKILIYWFLGSIPFVALALARLWEGDTVGRVLAAVAMIILVAAGSLDVWRTVSGQVSMRVFDRDALNMAQQMKLRTEPGALVLNAPTFNSPVVLSGRQSLMRYSGHLFSHGIDHVAREADVKRIYEGGGASEELLKRYGIDYVLVTPEERNTLKANEQFFARFPVAVEAGQNRLYKVK